MKNKNILLFTDIGDDIDDSLALTYLLTKTEHNLISIITWGQQQEKLYALHSLLDILKPKQNPIILAGSESAEKKISPSGFDKIIHNLPEEYEILSIGPMTDIPTLLNKAPHPPKHIYSQGTVCANGSPDDACYNYKHDMKAAHKVLHHKTPHTWVDKDLSYQHRISHKSFETYAKNQHSGQYLYEQAVYWQERFKKLNPKKYQEVYGTNNILSYPYDLLAAIALDRNLPPGRVDSLEIPEDILTILY